MKRFSWIVLVVLLIVGTSLGQSSKKGGLTGWDYFKQKRYDVALELLAKDARLYPKSHEIQDGLGWCYFFRGDLDQAETCFKKALSIDKNYRYSKMGLESVKNARLGEIVRAETLLAQSRYTESVATFDAILEKRPRPHDDILNRCYRGRGYCYYYLGLYQKALKDLKKANRIVRNDPVTSAGIGFVELARKKYSLADIAFEHTIKYDPNNLQVRLSHGWCAYYSGNSTAALRRFEKARELFPQSWGAVYGMAWSLNKKGDKDKAFQLFRRALEMSPSAATADLLAWIRQDKSRNGLLVDYGFALTEFGQYLSAQQVFRSAATNVERDQMLLGDALCALNQGDNLGALRITKSLHDRGQDPQRDQRVPNADGSATTEVELSASTIAGWAHLRLGEADEAATMFEKALELQGEWADAHAGLGYVRIAQKKYLEAEMSFQKSLAAMPDYSPAIEGMKLIQVWRFEDYNRAWALIGTGELDGASAIFKNLRQDPAKRFPRARIDLIDYSLGHIARLQSRPRDAAKLFRSALQRNPKLTDAGVGLGWALVSLREYGDAKRVLEPLLAQLPNDPRPRKLLARALIEWNRGEEVFDLLAQWVKDFPTDAELNDRYGRMLIAKNRHIEARIAFTAVVNSDPEYIAESELSEWMSKFEEFRPLYGTLGWAFYNRSKYEKSVANFTKAVELEPGEALHKKGLALACSASKKFDEAEKYAEAWIQTLGKTAADKAAWRALDMTLGWNLYSAGLTKRALRRFQKVEKREGRDKDLGVDLLSALGWTWFQMGKPARARSYFLKALAKEPRLETASQGLEAINKGLRK